MSNFEETAEYIFIGFVKYFVVFCFGVGAGYFWAMKAYGIIAGG